MLSTNEPPFGAVFLRPNFDLSQTTTIFLT
nr:MAG TPA: hypothetical protein [Caudoviricetes sp.]